MTASVTRLKQIATDLDPVDLGQVRLDVARREPSRGEHEDLVVEARETPLALPDDLRLEAALAIPRRLDPHQSVLGRKRLRCRAVAGVAGGAGRLLVQLVAEMLSQLSRHRPLHQPLRQLRDHTARPDDLLLSPGAREQLVDHLVGEAIADRVRKLERLAAIRSVLVFADMALLRSRHAYTADRTTPRRTLSRLDLFEPERLPKHGSSRS